METTTTILETAPRPPVEQFMRARGTSTYRDYEQAGMTVTYHDGEPVTAEEPAVAWDAYPAHWDAPVEHFTTTYTLTFRDRRGSGGNWADRKDEVQLLADIVRYYHSDDFYSDSCFCPECGGTVLEGTYSAVCDTCDWSRQL